MYYFFLFLVWVQNDTPPCIWHPRQVNGIATLSIHNQTALATIALWAAGTGGAGVHAVDQAFPSATTRC